MVAHPLIHGELARERQSELRRAATRPRRPSRRTKASADARPDDLASLVRAARSGEPQAWETLVARFTPALRATARNYRLAAADVDDVVQAAWTSALTHIGSLREPEAISGWVTVIARREALRIIKHRRGELLIDEPWPTSVADVSTPESALLDAERHEAVHAAVDQLPSRQRHLVRALFGNTEPNYDELALKLGMPKGSIGPTRKRALAQLRRDRKLIALASLGPGGATI